MKDVYHNIDSSVWGLETIKEEILNYVAQCITHPESKLRPLALCGEPGLGKTKIVRDGIQRSLNRPMKCFSMGGIKDSSSFLGFDYTYAGSRHGAIVQSLIECKIMNPILFFDELDKISGTKDGVDVENMLIHLTDPIQNFDFNDKWFQGIPIDISKSLLIFSFNNIENVSPILRDRLHIVHIQTPTLSDKVNICKKYFIPELVTNFKFQVNDIVLDESLLKYIINRYTEQESGVRKLKRSIESIVMKINTLKLLGDSAKDLKLSISKIHIQFPMVLTKDVVDVLLNNSEFHSNSKCSFMYI
jgi:ATP-dependent Lon protease